MSDDSNDSKATVPPTSEGMAANAEPASAGDAVGPADDTPEMPENQAKGSPQRKTPLDLAARIERRLTAINQLHIEKESLQLNYVYKKIPKPYYQRWKFEGNELFSLCIGLRRRARDLKAKNGG